MLDQFPIARHWAPAHPDRIQLYSLPTPNGVKVSIALEELGLPYEVHRIDFAKDEQKSEAFRSLNPNGKIPAMIDIDGPNGQPIGLFESGTILHYLADKTGRLLPDDRARRWEAIAWLHFQVGGIGPMFCQVGYFNIFAGKEIDDPRPLDRYVSEARRLLGVLDERLADGPWIMGADYSIADIATLGWIRNLITFYEARELVDFDAFEYLPGWLDRWLARPAVQRGLNIPARPET
nr:glutathione S-transferase N-terminal domain-containing protein [Sphingorhabdus soli]